MIPGLSAHVFMSEHEAAQRCQVWQSVLRLQDWRVWVSIKRARDFEKKEVSGEVQMYLKSKEATIALLDPLDYPPTCLVPQNHERTLVHELLHLHFSTLGDDLEHVALEQIIHCLEDALLGMNGNLIQTGGDTIGEG